MRHLDLFSGIGGFALAAQTVWGEDYQNVGFCDIEPFAQAVLKKHWPNAVIYGDIRTLKGSDIGSVDLLTGGFPCQPFSAAGQRRGTADNRHLWPQMLRVIRETSPAWIIGENVGGLLTWNGGMVLDQVFASLEAEGYEVWAFVIPACAVNAPHRRDRVWIVAHDSGGRRYGGQASQGRHIHGDGSDYERNENTGEPAGSAAIAANADGLQSERWREPSFVGSASAKEHSERIQRQRTGNASINCGADATDAPSSGRRERNAQCGWAREGTRAAQERHRPSDSSCSQWADDWPKVAARLCTLDDGLPTGLVRPRGWRNATLKAAGNAIVPQVAEQIMLAIKSTCQN